MCSRTLIGFESKSGHPQLEKGETFFTFVSMPQHEKGPPDLHFTHFPSVMTVMESVSKTRLKMRWAEGQGESKKKKLLKTSVGCAKKVG